MAVSFAVGLRACCVALGLLVVAVRAAEPVSPLVGQTREQLLSRYGEPRSQIERGNRVIYFYPRERVVLRNNVVVDVEEISSDPASSVPSTPTPETKDATTSGVRPAPPSTARPAAPSTQPAPTSDSKLEIKLVLPRSAKDSRPSTVDPGKPAPQTQPAAEPASKTVPDTSVTSIPVPSPTEPSEETAGRAARVEVATPDPAAAKKSAEDREAKKKKEEALKAARRRMEEAPTNQPTESVISGRTYLLAFVVVAGGIGLLYWRYHQRQLELAASSVENTPVSPVATTPVFTGNGFSADVLNQLEWKRFEELVAAYYSKTGVVAVRTKTGPDSPVHIKISWKGEPRPFAYVQCLPHPAGLIDPKPLQALVASLAADDIRRGYVVTSGKFNVLARDFAEEKHLTLLPGDIFLEKLNALPASARAEIMQSISAADDT